MKKDCAKTLVSPALRRFESVMSGRQRLHVMDRQGQLKERPRRPLGKR
ncbi:hypothetical protein FQN60_000112 [Etheostoma spectabile]|uniref:Uncharacterized protein n=1 Tax=Etheostoma spectabile TaxID=54343 RepID=A0A5J5CAN3_9PERO|nr:hypothetical protein FQN60_000112 [Etheostoma spectabile]